MSSSVLKNLTHELEAVVKRQEWEDCLSPPLQQLLRRTEGAIEALNTLVIKYRSTTFTINDLIDIRDTWLEASSYVVIKGIYLTIDGRGYAEYGGTRFDTIEKLNELIKEFPDGGILVQTLKSDDHTLSVEI